MDDKSYFRIPKKWVRTGLVVAVTALIVAPLTAVAFVVPNGEDRLS